jgi:hypothetical protein
MTSDTYSLHMHNSAQFDPDVQECRKLHRTYLRFGVAEVRFAFLQFAKHVCLSSQMHKCANWRFKHWMVTTDLASYCPKLLST